MPDFDFRVDGGSSHSDSSRCVWLELTLASSYKHQL